MEGVGVEDWKSGCIYLWVYCSGALSMKCMKEGKY